MSHGGGNLSDRAERQQPRRNGARQNDSHYPLSPQFRSAQMSSQYVSSRRRHLLRSRSAPLSQASLPNTFLACGGSTTNKTSKSSGDTDAAIKAEIAKEDAMIYLDGPQIYTCGQCRTHLTSHDNIISKSFHGRHGRAYLFDQCVNVSLGRAESRNLITGIHSVCDIFCNRCESLVGWTYIKAYEASQKYKEGKYIIEKINLHLEETLYGIEHPAGERSDRWRVRAMSWGSHDDRQHRSSEHSASDDIVYEYAAFGRDRSPSLGGHPPPPMNVLPPAPSQTK